MARTVLDEKHATSSEPFLSYVMEKAFGARKEMRKKRQAIFDISTASSDAVMQEQDVTAVVASFVQGIERSMPDLVTFSPSLVDQFPWERLSTVTVDDDFANKVLRWNDYDERCHGTGIHRGFPERTIRYMDVQQSIQPHPHGNSALCPLSWTCPCVCCPSSPT
jgi:hypothetical protein